MKRQTRQMLIAMFIIVSILIDSYIMEYIRGGKDEPHFITALLFLYGWVLLIYNSIKNF